MSLTLPTVTGYSEFWGGANQYAPLRKRSSIDARAMLLLARNRPVRAAMDAYVNSGATPAISDSYKRVTAVRNGAGTDLSGDRPIETVTVVNTTGDASIASDLDGMLDRFHDARLVYPDDLSGNGGGGKNGF